MKTPLFIFFICFFFSINAFSQLNGNYNYSLSLTGFSNMQNPKIFNQDDQKYINSYANGIMLKLNDNQINYRIGAGFLQKNVAYSANCINCDIANGKITDYTFKIGFEKNLSYGWLQPYFAFDLGYRYNRFKGIMNTINSQQATSATYHAQDTKDGFTTTPILGVKLNPSEKFTFFAESGFQLFYAHGRQLTTSDNSYNKGQILINSVAVGIQAHFGNKN